MLSNHAFGSSPSVGPFSATGGVPSVAPMASGTICIFSNGQLIPLTAASPSVAPMASGTITSFGPFSATGGVPSVAPMAKGGMCFFSTDSSLTPFCV